MKVISSKKCEPLDKVEIKKVKQLGKGGQAEVFRCKLVGHEGRFVSKNKKVFNNFRLAEEVLMEMFSEFFIGKDLDHPHIVRYNYFIN